MKHLTPDGSGLKSARNLQMPQLELPGIITYGDGSWEIINLNPNKIRGDIRKNYPLGNPMHGFTVAIQNDFHARKQNLETNLQSELNQTDNTHPPLANVTPGAWLSRTLNIVNEFLFNNELQEQLKISIALLQGLSRLQRLKPD